MRHIIVYCLSIYSINVKSILKKPYGCSFSFLLLSQHSFYKIQTFLPESTPKGGGPLCLSTCLSSPVLATREQNISNEEQEDCMWLR